MSQAREIEQLMSDPERWDAMSEADKAQKQQDLAQSQGRGQVLQVCAAEAISTCAYSYWLCQLPAAGSLAGWCLHCCDFTACRISVPVERSSAGHQAPSPGWWQGT